MSGAWLVIAPIAVIALLFVLKALRDVSRSVGTLVQSMQELNEVGIGLNKLRDELAARRAAGEDVPPQ
jgi:Sec-independent protein translocase protein TatA